MSHPPHPYGDCDGCGDPRKLLSLLEEEGKRLGVQFDTEALNSWELGISIGGPGVAAMILALRQASEPVTKQQIDALLLEHVDGIDEIGG